MIKSIETETNSKKPAVNNAVSIWGDEIMKYSLYASSLYYLCGFFYMAFGTYALDINAKSHVNRLFIMVTSSTATWAFAYSVSVSAPTAEVSAFWGCISVFGWGIFYSIMLHFAFILTKTEPPFNKKILLTIIYLPAVINIFLFAPFGYYAEKQYRMVKTDFGWLNVLPLNMGKIWFITYYSVFTIAILILLIRWWKKMEPQDPQKRQATYFLISILFPLVLGVTTETIPDILGKNPFPELTIVFLIVPVTLLSSTLRKSGLLLERPAAISLPLESDHPEDADRLRMFRTVASIFTAGSAVSFFIGYFALNRTTREEILLSITLLSLAIFIRSIPQASRPMPPASASGACPP